ncbi:MAG: hypothetical protein NT096_12350 [Proteobacteria bacterium]|nr:hypothetical protein [Pseudomonadota bacterium]
MFYAIVLAYIVYGILFILKTSVVIQGVRYFTLFDDSMISMRYAKNLVHGHGLVWNPGGARVEGYTNFLWTIYMAFWHILPISSAKISLSIQLSGLVFLISSLFLIRRIASHISSEDSYVSMGAVILTASYQPITYWALKGMETSVLGFIVLLLVWRVIICLERNSLDIFLFVILGIGLLIRPDMTVLLIGISLFLIVTLPEHRAKNAFFTLLIFLLTQGALMIFRLVYYHDILPNTYYLKMTGVPLILRIKRGALMGLYFIDGMSYFLFALPFMFSILYRKNKILFLAYLFLIQFFYSIYVGGDSWEWWGHLANRFICIVMPLFFILLSLIISSLIKGFANYKPMADVLKKACFAILLLLSIIQLHGGFGMDVFRKLIDWPGILIEVEKHNIVLALKLREITTPQAKIALGGAGGIPYFLDRYCIDLLGKNDAFIAHQKTKYERVENWDPGHNKYDWGYSIGELKPDVVLDYDERWYSPKEIQFFRENYKIFKTRLNSEWVTIYFRGNSSHIDWSKGSIVEWPEGHIVQWRGRPPNSL